MKECLAKAIQNKITNNAPVCERVSGQIIEKCVHKLKSGKSDGGQGLDSDHLLYGTSYLYELISGLRNAMIVHGHTANALLHSTIVSIPKSLHASLSSSDNY